jgi:hypothetical protein
LGGQIIDKITGYAIEQNKHCACKFILVDAYQNAIGFYEKMQFKYLTDTDANMFQLTVSLRIRLRNNGKTLKMATEINVIH